MHRALLLAAVGLLAVAMLAATRDSRAQEIASEQVSVPVEVSHVEAPKPTQSHTIEMEVTAYCACTKCCGPNAQGITASGKRVNYNNGVFVAADTRVLKFGTKLIIPGYNSDQAVEVIDKGGAIKGNKLDLFFPTHQAALEWGRQHLTVTVLD